MITQNAKDDGKNLALIALDDFAERYFVAGLDASDKGRLFTGFVVHACSGPFRGGGRYCRKAKYFGQAVHDYLSDVLCRNRVSERFFQNSRFVRVSPVEEDRRLALEVWEWKCGNGRLRTSESSRPEVLGNIRGQKVLTPAWTAWA